MTDSCLSLRFPFLFLIYPKSGAAGGVLRKGSTTTITLAAFMERYPELLDLSPADQTVQYQAYLLYSNGMTVDELDAHDLLTSEEEEEESAAYLLYSNGMTVDELDASYHTHDDGPQEGGGAGASGAFRCCKDRRASPDCRRTTPESGGISCWDRHNKQYNECVVAGMGGNRMCCLTCRLGSKNFVWEACT